MVLLVKKNSDQDIYSVEAEMMIHVRMETKVGQEKEQQN